MKSICYVIVYFGKLPDTMKLWLKSCRFNPTVNWIIYTDDKDLYDYPDNVAVRYCTFNDFKNKVQDKFPFEIKIDTPYRLCDYKVAYGYILEEELKEFDFWGYCDLDMVFVNIRSFLTEDILNKYDRIGFLGHSTLYKNTYNINRLFMKEIDGNEIYKKIFSSGGNENHFFDEKWMDLICQKYCIETYRNTIFADIIPWAWKFRIGYVDDKEKIKNEHRIFLWDDGTLLSCSIENKNKVIYDQYMYIHLLKRQMKYRLSDDTQRFLIVPNKFLAFSRNVSKLTVFIYSINNMGLYWLDVIKRKWKKISIKNVTKYFIIRQKAKKQYYNEKGSNN